jgi:raffinose/stachyose/melibiose transport system permease protein
MLSSSFKTLPQFFSGGLSLWPPVWQLDNYRQVWADGFAGFFLNTVLVSGGATMVVILAASMLGYSLAYTEFIGRRVLLALIGLVLFMPPTYNFIPIVTMVAFLHLNDTLIGVALVMATYGLPVSTLLYYGYYRTIPKELIEAAALDGATPFRTYLHVVMPLVGPITVTVGLLQIVSSWNNVVIPLVLTLGNPALETLAVGLYSYNGTHLANYVLICAGASLSIVPIALMFLVAQRYFVKSIAGALKA